MKKILSVLLSLAIVFSMAACGNGNNQSSQSSTANEIPDFIPGNNDVQAQDNPETSYGFSRDESSETSGVDDGTGQDREVIF